MKFRIDFVTNSSSSSFMVITFPNSQLTKYLASIGIKFRCPYSEVEDLTEDIEENDEHKNEIDEVADRIRVSLSDMCMFGDDTLNTDEVVESGIVDQLKELESLTNPSYQTAYIERNCFFELPSGKIGTIYEPEWGNEGGFYWKRPDEFGSLSAWMIYCLLQGMCEQGHAETLKEFIEIINKATNENIKMPEKVGCCGNSFDSYEFSFFDKFDSDIGWTAHGIKIGSAEEGDPVEYVMYDHCKAEESIRSRIVDEDEEPW